MSTVRKTLTVLALTALATLGLAGTSHANTCEWWFDGAGVFYCQQN
ncbi:hypothetical protein [Streptomyces roseolus]